MPGIAGLISKRGREWAEPQLERMVAALVHEKSYQSGIWIDAGAGIYAGLVSRGNAAARKAPLVSRSGGKKLLFSGEEFSDPSARSFFEKNGHAPAAEPGWYLAELAEEAGQFPALLNGIFQGLLLDGREGSATLFNDRYGMHRLYVHEGKDAFYFAAEAKAILAVCPELRSVDPHGMAELITCGCVLENRSIFRGVEVLPPGSAWSFRNGVLAAKDSYFRPAEWENQGALGEEEYYRQLREVFARVVPRHFSGPNPVSMSLTGGLDSRMIMAWAKAPAGALKCFSFGGIYRDCQDVVVARRVARACGQPHEVIQLGSEFLGNFAHYAERSVYLTDGCVDISRTPDLYINEKARTIAPVRMTGNYGGEVLRAIRAFKPIEPQAGIFSPELSRDFAGARQTYLGLIGVHPLSFSVFRQAPWHHYGLRALEETQLALRSPYLDNEFVRTVFRAPESTLHNNDISFRLVEDGDAGLRLRRLRGDLGQTDSAAGRLADLRRRYFEFTFKAEYAYDYGMPQWVARTDHALSALHLERLFLGRHKFSHFRVWYRDALASYVKEMLLDSRSLSRPYLQRRTVEQMVAGHLKGDQNHTRPIHKLLTLEYLHRLFIDA